MSMRFNDISRMFKFRVRDFIRRHWAPILLLLVLMSVNSAVFFGGRTLLPIAPSYGVMPGVPYGYKGAISDWTITLDPGGAFNCAYAYDAYTVSTLRQGTFPFWNPYQGLGKPSFMNYLSAVLYPANLLHLVLPPAYWDVVFLLNWWLAAVFMYAYLRLWDLEPGAALVGAVIVLSSGFFQLYLPLREIPGVAAWWPLLLYGIERAVREPDWRARHFVLAVGVYCSINGGQPEVTFVSLLVVLIYGLVRLLVQPGRAWRGLLALAPGSLAGLLLAAPLWLNFASYAFTAYSVHTPEQRTGTLHLGINSIATYFFPYLYGRVQVDSFGPVPGWSWGASPGWLSSVALFLAIASLPILTKKPRLVVAFLWAVAIVVAAKICGVPGINLLGELPLLERIVFPRYASFLLAFAFAGLAAFGVKFLSQVHSRKWVLWVIAWVMITLALLALGVQPIWPALQEKISASENSAVLILGGVVWALTAPLGLWWIKYRRPDDKSIFFVVAAMGVILQGISYATNGYSDKTYVVLSFTCLAIYFLFAAIIGLVRGIGFGLVLMGSGLTVAASIPLITAFFITSGLPSRYDPLTTPPYVGVLRDIQEGNLYRSFSLDGTPQPDFAAPFGFTSLDNMDALSPAGTAEFVRSYLDSRVMPTWFAGNLSFGTDPNRTVLDELRKNKRYFDLVGVRYLVTRDTDPNRPPSKSADSSSQNRAPIQLIQPLEVSSLCFSDNLSYIEVLLSTYARKNQGVVTLRIFDLEGTLLARSDVDSASLVDNNFQRFEFPAIKGFKGRQLRLRLEYQPNEPGAMIVAWKVAGQSSFIFRIPSTEPLFATVYRDDLDTGVRIWENRQAIPRVFLAPIASMATSWQDAIVRLSETPDLTRKVWLEQGPPIESTWPSGQPTSMLESFQLASNDVWVKFQAHTTGILTLTDSYLVGWHAMLNGREVPVLCVNGAFRGVRIDEPGSYDLHFWYRPQYWNISLAMAGAGLLLMVGGTFLSRRKSRSTQKSDPV